jgi:hypothetical protein
VVKSPLAKNPLLHPQSVPVPLLNIGAPAWTSRGTWFVPLHAIFTSFKRKERA